MFRQAGLAFLLLSACSCGNGGGDVDAMVPDAEPPQPDAAPDAAPPGPLGLWRAEDVVSDGTPLGVSGSDRYNMTLELVSDGSLALGGIEVAGGRLVMDSTFGMVAPYAVAPDGVTVTAAGSTWIWDQTPPESMHSDWGALEATFARHDHTDTEMQTIVGQISFAPGGVFAPMTNARVGLVFLLRSPSGPPETIQVPGGDIDLPGFGATSSDTTTFDLSRTEGALGVERITFGTTAFGSIGLIVLYDDLDGTVGLDTTTFWTSCGAGEDCVRGVSPLVLAYRLGNAQELADSQYAFMRKGWTPAVIVDDVREATARKGLVSLDKTAETPPFDILAPPDPIDVILVEFDL